jgi:hypothetical protein
MKDLLLAGFEADLGRQAAHGRHRREPAQSFHRRRRPQWSASRWRGRLLRCLLPGPPCRRLRHCLSTLPVSGDRPRSTRDQDRPTTGIKQPSWRDGLWADGTRPTEAPARLVDRLYSGRRSSLRRPVCPSPRGRLPGMPGGLREATRDAAPSPNGDADVDRCLCGTPPVADQGRRSDHLSADGPRTSRPDEARAAAVLDSHLLESVLRQVEIGSSAPTTSGPWPDGRLASTHDRRFRFSPPAS